MGAQIPQWDDLTVDEKRVARRHLLAVQAGLSDLEAQMWAESDEPTDLLRKCVAAGATVDELRRIVL
jgi:hypothetical protein